jgi:hypothetical protein
MSAFAHFADSSRTSREVREVPEPAVSTCSNMPCAEGRVIRSLVGAGEQRRRRMVLRRGGLLHRAERARDDDRRGLRGHPRPACRRWAAIPRGGAIQRSSAVARRRVLALPASERFAPLFLRTAAFDVIPAGRDGVARFGRSRIISGSVEDRRNSSQYSAQAPLPGKSLNSCVKPH